MEIIKNIVDKALNIAEKGGQATQVHPNIQQLRYKMCEMCSEFNKEKGRCKKCGCYMKTKTAYNTIGGRIVKCPLNKW